MIFRVDRIKEDVRVCIDQNASSAQIVSDNDMDMLTLEDVIGSKILEGIDRVHSAAPYYLLEQGHNIHDDIIDEDGDVVEYGPSIHWGNMASGWIVLPDDFMRLVVFEMSDWERPVYNVLTPDSPQYAKCRSRVKALRGTAQRPVCALVVRPEGKTLEFYSCKTTDASITKAVYIPYASIDRDGGVDISERCYKAVIYAIAGLVMASCSETDKATMFFDKSNTYLTK